MSEGELPAPGEIIGGKYRLDALLGRGGMGAVYSATNEVTGKRVAVKWMVRGSDAAVADRFLREARIASSINHPNVVNVFDLGSERGSHYLIMELLAGEPLSDLLDRGTLHEQTLVEVLMPALRGVHAAHSAGVVHRDLKPSNVFLCRSSNDGSFEAKVLDFGISKRAGDEISSITRTGTVLGTPHYMSPEHVRAARSVTVRSDVYALGVILYEALSGALPFDDESFSALAVKIATEDPPPLGSLRSDISPRMLAIVERAMAKDPARRFASVRELAVALESCARGVKFGLEFDPHAATLDGALAADPSPSVGSSPSGERSPRIRPWVFALVAFLAVSGAAIAYAAIAIAPGPEDVPVHAAPRADHPRQERRPTTPQARERVATEPDVEPAIPEPREPPPRMREARENRSAMRTPEVHSDDF